MSGVVAPVASTMTDEGSLVGRIGRLPGISLAELDRVAALQQRTDRKYLVPVSQAVALVDDLAGRFAALDIDGRRESAYRSTYFDTPALDSYHGTARGRRQRFKVRTRTYLDSSTTMLEVKTKAARKQTIKTRRRHRSGGEAVLDVDDHAFVEAATGRAELGALLRPIVATEYSRTTLVDLDDVARLTIDGGLRCRDLESPGLEEVGLVDVLVVETKSGGGPSAADRWLWNHGTRPLKFSKFATGLAALRPDLPSNKWHRTLCRHF